MHTIDGMSLDLNQLRVLAVLLQERSVTRAARRLGLTQPTISHALGKLREQFGDPLLVRSGREMLLTPRAAAMEPGLQRALDTARIERRVGFTAPGFLVALMAVAQTEMFFAAPRELVVPLLSTFRLQILDPPAPLPPIAVALTWHERFQAEPGHKWLRELLVRVGQEALESSKKAAFVG